MQPFAEQPQQVPQPQSVVAQPQSVVPQPQSVVPQPQPVVPQPQPVVSQPQSVVPQPQSVVPQSMVPQFQAGQTQLVLVQSSATKEQYDAVTSRVLGTLQITGGVLAMVSQAILTGLGSITMYSGAGFWAGIMIVTYMVLAIVGSVFTTGIFGSAPVALAVDRSTYRPNRDYYLYNDGVSVENGSETNMTTINETTVHSVTTGHVDDTSTGPFVGTPREKTEIPYNTYTPKPYTSPPPSEDWRYYWISSVVFNSLLLIIATVELVTFIWGSALACKAMCCGNEPKPVAVPIQYVNGQILTFSQPLGCQALPILQPNSVQPAPQRPIVVQQPIAAQPNTVTTPYPLPGE